MACSRYLSVGHSRRAAKTSTVFWKLLLRVNGIARGREGFGQERAAYLLG